SMGGWAAHAGRLTARALAPNAAQALDATARSIAAARGMRPALESFVWPRAKRRLPHEISQFRREPLLPGPSDLIKSNDIAPHGSSLKAPLDLERSSFRQDEFTYFSASSCRPSSAVPRPPAAAGGRTKPFATPRSHAGPST